MSGSDPSNDSVRVDVWLWAVRVFKTRSASNKACRSGKVLVSGKPAKPSKVIAVGELVEAQLRERTVRYRVAIPIKSRVGATIVPSCIDDLSPPPPTPRQLQGKVGARQPGLGRPTKKERRALDRFRRNQ